MEDHPSPEVIIVHFRYRHGWKGGGEGGGGMIFLMIYLVFYQLAREMIHGRQQQGS